MFTTIQSAKRTVKQVADSGKLHLHEVTLVSDSKLVLMKNPCSSSNTSSCWNILVYTSALFCREMHIYVALLQVQTSRSLQLTRCSLSPQWAEQLANIWQKRLANIWQNKSFAKKFVLQGFRKRVVRIHKPRFGAPSCGGHHSQTSRKSRKNRKREKEF